MSQLISVNATNFFYCFETGGNSMAREGEANALLAGIVGT